MLSYDTTCYVRRMQPMSWNRRHGSVGMPTSSGAEHERGDRTTVHLFVRPVAAVGPHDV
jgi:hypothetical protein